MTSLGLGTPTASRLRPSRPTRWLPLAALTAAACGRSDAAVPPPTPAHTAEIPTGQRPLDPSTMPAEVGVVVPPFRVSVRDATLQRWAGDAWMVRATVTVSNTTQAVQYFHGGDGVDIASEVPDRVVMAPLPDATLESGRSFTGTAVWSTRAPSPHVTGVSVVVVTNNGGSRASRGMFVPATFATRLEPASTMVMAAASDAPGATPGAAGAASAPPPTGFFRALRERLSFRDYDVGFSAPISYRWYGREWVVRANVTFTNRTSREIQVDRTAFSATSGGTAMQEARNSETFPEQATVQPGQSVSGTVAFYYDASMPQPLRVEVHYGAVDNAGDFPFSTSIAPVLGPQP